MPRQKLSSYQPITAKPSQWNVGRLAEARINGGVITMIDPVDLENGQLQQGKNITVRFDVTSRRAGSQLLTPTKPDSNPVLELIFVKLKNGSGYTYRFTKSDIYLRNTATWDAITGAGLLGTNTDRIELVNILNTIIFSNNGKNKIQLLDPVGGTYADLGNAPAYRHITGFYNRAVGAALAGVDETRVGWSADGVATEWDPTINETAGFSPILESPSDLSDHISGIFGFTNVMILLREESIWLATKKPIPTDPFNFYTVFPGIGCDTSNTVAIIPNGLAWLDTRTNTVWAYVPGSNPEPIGRPVEKNILRGIDDPATCFASYNGRYAEYTLCIPRAATSVVTTWTFNFRTKTWAEGEYDNISCISDTELAAGSIPGRLMIDDLIGTIDSLAGFIDDLISAPSSGTEINVRLFGKNDGDVLVENPALDTDGGTIFETIIDSKVYTIPSDDTSVAEFRLDLIKTLPGDIEIWWSKDAGVNFVLWRTIRNTQIPVGRAEIIKTFGPLKARDYVWRVRATAGAFDLRSYEILISSSGMSKET